MIDGSDGGGDQSLGVEGLVKFLDGCDGNGTNFDDQDDEDVEEIDGRQQLLLLYLSIRGGGWKMS